MSKLRFEDLAEGETVSNVTQEISAIEKRSLADLERTIAAGINELKKACAALKQIHDERLYRAEFPSFEAYCAARWNISRSRAYELIGAAGVLETVSAIADTTPANEAQVRPLAQLHPDEQGPAWKEAVETAPEGKVTAKHVMRVVKARLAQNGSPNQGAEVEPAAPLQVEVSVTNEQGVSLDKGVGKEQHGTTEEGDTKQAASEELGTEEVPSKEPAAGKQSEIERRELGAAEKTQVRKVVAQLESKLPSVVSLVDELQELLGNIQSVTCLAGLVIPAQKHVEEKASQWRAKHEWVYRREVKSNQRK